MYHGSESGVEVCGISRKRLQSSRSRVLLFSYEKELSSVDGEYC